MPKLIVLAIALFASGCALSPQMNADQLNTVTNNPNAQATVVNYVGVGGQGTITTLNADKGTLGTNGGSATVEPNGKITIIVNPRATPAAKPVVVDPSKVPQ